MFADDTNLLLDMKKLFNDMNFELQKMSIWFKANNLSLTLAKMKWALFHSQKKSVLLRMIYPYFILVILKL